MVVTGALGNATTATLLATYLGADAAGRVLGLLQQEPEAWFRWQPAGGAALDESAIADFIRRRQEARKSRNFAEADRIREELAEQGILLEDGPQGTIWRRKD